jgi:hypothetical protein
MSKPKYDIKTDSGKFLLILGISQNGKDNFKFLNYRGLSAFFDPIFRALLAQNLL